MTAVAVRQDEHPAAVAIPATSSITHLLQTAVEKGTPVEALEKLVALHERMEAREAAQAFANAMAAFQSACPSIKKSSTADIVTRKGGRYSYTYAELDEIARTVNPILAKHGLSYSWDSTVEAGMLNCVCTIRHIKGHFTTSRLSLPVASESAMSEQQKYGAALTFAQRRTLSSGLGLTTTDEDADAADFDRTPINAMQLIQLEDMIEDSGADKGRFLKFIGVDKLGELPAVHFEQAMNALRQKKGAE
jgi:hypothetical protein